MNRRDLLKRMLALPAIAAPAALLATATARMTYHAPFLPGPWNCVNGHPYCNRCVSSPLTEESLEDLLRQIKDWADERGVPIRREFKMQSMEGDFPIEALRYEHVWKPAVDICQRCGVTCLEIEDGRATKFCPGPPEDVCLYGFGVP